MNVTYSASCLVFAISSCEPFIVDGVVAELTEELAGKYWSFVLSFAVANSTTNLKRHFNPTLLELGGRQNTPGYFSPWPFPGWHAQRTTGRSPGSLQGGDYDHVCPV